MGEKTDGLLVIWLFPFSFSFAIIFMSLLNQMKHLRRPDHPWQIFLLCIANLFHLRCRDLYFSETCFKGLLSLYFGRGYFLLLFFFFNLSPVWSGIWTLSMFISWKSFFRSGFWVLVWRWSDSSHLTENWAGNLKCLSIANRQRHLQRSHITKKLFYTFWGRKHVL